MRQGTRVPSARPKAGMCSTFRKPNSFRSPQAPSLGAIVTTALLHPWRVLGPLRTAPEVVPHLPGSRSPGLASLQPSRPCQQRAPHVLAQVGKPQARWAGVAPRGTA